MADKSFLDWPFFEPRHRELAAAIDAWARSRVEFLTAADDEDDACRALVRELGEAGFLKHAVVAPHGGAGDRLDVRSLCIIRETLSRHHGLADFAFAMQGLGSGPICLSGTDDQRARFLPQVAAGEALAAFALTEPQAGSDAGAIALTVRPQQRRLRAQWREDLDFQRRDRRPVCRLRAYRGGTGRTWSLGPDRAGRHAGAHDRRAARRDRAPSPRAAQVRELRSAARKPDRRGRAGFQDRHVHPGCIPLYRRRRGAWLCAPGDGRGGGLCECAQDRQCGHRRHADPASQDRRHGNLDRCRPRS